MTTGEIEDVLSSIRRLVSDDTRLTFRAVPRPPADGGKLILTPAQRVTPSEATDDEADGPETTRIGSVVTAIAAAVEPPPDGWESETGDPLASAAPLRTADPVPADWDSAEASDTQPVLTLTLGAMQRRAALAAVPSAPPPAPETVEEEAGVEAGDNLAAIETPPPQDVLLTDAAADLPLQDAADDGWDDDAPETLLQGQEDASRLGPVASLPDPDTLRAIVREVLREELQGPLGERITRNLRKLVRAEIARALSAHAAE